MSVIGVRWRVEGRGVCRASQPGPPFGSLVVPRCGDGHLVAGCGGSCVAEKSRANAVCQGQAAGRCMVMRRADRASRTGMVIRVRRMVAVVVEGPLEVVHLFGESVGALALGSVLVGGEVAQS